MLNSGELDFPVVTTIGYPVLGHVLDIPGSGRMNILQRAKCPKL
jgi:hypothetical protein